MDADAYARTGVGARLDDPLTGRVLDGRYEVGDRIARGGMASVHEALDLRLDRVVAVKVMHPGLVDGSDDGDVVAERFVREARAAARLSHPNVVAVYDQGEDDGTVFLAMELVEGHTLRDTIHAESPMAPARALALLEPVLSALAAAHRAGIVHRDVKPENVLIARDGRVKVADFGLARAVSADTRHTATQGVLIGTVSYLAPELVLDGRADARADVYAAGVVLYELLTGTKPYEGETPIQVAYQHVNRDVPPPSALVPGLPGYVDALVARATCRDRTRRPADAGVLLHQVHRVAAALAAGVREDVELERDLRPAPGPQAGPDTAPLSQAPRQDTTPEPWDLADVEALFADEAAPAPARSPAPAPAPPPARTPASTPARGGPAAPPRPRRSRRGPLLLVLALLLAAAVGGGAFWYGWARYDTAPSVLGDQRDDAVATLEDAGLDVQFADPVYDADARRGTVVAADPRGGSRVLSGDTVTLTVSLGRLLVPKVRGLDEDGAQDALLDKQLEFGTSIQRWSEKQPEGTVLGSKPKAGVQLDPGDTVDLVVSKGPRPITVGHWVGTDLDTATAKLEKRGLTVTVGSEEYSDDVPEGAIIAQDPTDGTLFRGDQVTFTVSRGPELVEVPSVRAYGVDAAVQKLEDLGFVVEQERNSEYLGLGFAVRTDPESGSLAPVGSTITLYVL